MDDDFDWWLNVHGAAMPEAQERPAPVQPAQSPFKTAPLPDPMHNCPRPWGETPDR